MALVSVGIPVFNGEQHLEGTLDSLLAQSLKDFEIIIADNASTDRTEEICRRYEAKDERVIYHRNDENIGAAPNFNRAFDLSSAPLYHPGAHDDLYHPAFLERCVEALDHDPNLVLSYARTKLIDDEGQPLPFDKERNCFVDSQSSGGVLMKPIPTHIGRAESPEERFREVLWPMGAALPLSGVVRRDVMLKTSRYGNYSGADKVLVAELALHGLFTQIEVELFFKRVHQGGTHYKSARERAQHESAGASGIPQVKMLRDYTRMTFAADMGILQRLHCMVTIAGIARRGEVWQRLLLPGPDNYFGISFANR